MKLYSENKNYKLYQGNMLDMLEVIEPNTIDSIVTDPPYELNFMGKGWDNAGVSFQSDTWKKCYEVLKPGGYLLAFGGSRTFHRIACAIEDAGFEIRDTIMWLYGSGFPKSMNVGLALDKKNGVESKVVGIRKQTGAKFKLTQQLIDNGGFNDTERTSFEIKEAQNKWQGWGTALKPSFEPIIVARKPFKGSLVDNVIANGVGGINIDECRVGNEERTIPINAEEIEIKQNGSHLDTLHKNQQHERISTTQGRFPANTILTYDEMPSDERLRYFYCAKASKKDRDEGLDGFEEKLPASVTDFRPTVLTNPEKWNNGNPVDNPMMRTNLRKNIHPTVKPTELMQYLIRLVSPNGATILDPFNGSGSTGKAVMYENKERNKNYKYIGIELTEEYLPIAKARIEYVYSDSIIKQESYNFDDLD